MHTCLEIQSSIKSFFFSLSFLLLFFFTPNVLHFSLCDPMSLHYYQKGASATFYLPNFLTKAPQHPVKAYCNIQFNHFLAPISSPPPRLSLPEGIPISCFWFLSTFFFLPPPALSLPMLSSSERTTLTVQKCVPRGLAVTGRGGRMEMDLKSYYITQKDSILGWHIFAGCF